MNTTEKQKIEKQNRRLLKFAEHLNSMKTLSGQLFEEIELVALDKKIRTHYKVKYHYLIIDELPAAFEEFEYNGVNGDPIQKGKNPEEGVAASIIDFFGLGLEEFCHLFDVEGLQNIVKYGGKVLNYESDPADFAYNIVQFVRFRKFALQPKLGK